MKVKPPQRGDKPQIDKFKEAARELGTDDSEAAFDANLRKVAKKPSDAKDKPRDSKQDARS